MEKAIANGKERGSPSGTATTMIATEMVKKSRILMRVSLERRVCSPKVILIIKNRHMLTNKRNQQCSPLAQLVSNSLESMLERSQVGLIISANSYQVLVSVHLIERGGAFPTAQTTALA